MLESQKKQGAKMGFVDEMKILFSKEDENLLQGKDFQKIKMTYEDLVSYIHSSGMSIKEFAELLNMQPNSITNLKKEGTPIPKLLFAVALLVYKVNQLGGNAREVLGPFEFEKIKPKRKSGEKGLFIRKQQKN